jgi:hypothetical protein
VDAERALRALMERANDRRIMALIDRIWWISPPPFPIGWRFP